MLVVLLQRGGGAGRDELLEVLRDGEQCPLTRRRGKAQLRKQTLSNLTGRGGEERSIMVLCRMIFFPPPPPLNVSQSVGVFSSLLRLFSKSDWMIEFLLLLGPELIAGRIFSLSLNPT